MSGWIDLEKWEVLCSRCGGDKVVGATVCSFCLGEGKLDWIENVVGKNMWSATSSGSTGSSGVSACSVQERLEWRTSTTRTRKNDREVRKRLNRTSTIERLKLWLQRRN